MTSVYPASPLSQRLYVRALSLSLLIFGVLIDGLDVQKAIANSPRGAQDRPRQDIVIERLEICRG
jgi:cyclophilin family peptidyl-prolyl cis-trans isomerase